MLHPRHLLLTNKNVAQI